MDEMYFLCPAFGRMTIGSSGYHETMLTCNGPIILYGVE